MCSSLSLFASIHITGVCAWLGTDGKFRLVREVEILSLDVPNPVLNRCMATSMLENLAHGVWLRDLQSLWFCETLMLCNEQDWYTWLVCQSLAAFFIWTHGMYSRQGEDWFRLYKTCTWPALHCLAFACYHTTLIKWKNKFHTPDPQLQQLCGFHRLLAYLWLATQWSECSCFKMQHHCACDQIHRNMTVKCLVWYILQMICTRYVVRWFSLSNEPSMTNQQWILIYNMLWAKTLGQMC